MPLSAFSDKTTRFRIFVILMVLAVAAVEIRREFGTDLYIFYRQRLRDPQAIRKYLDTNKVRKLQLGAGTNNPPGWLNSEIEPNGDQIYLDVTSDYPFPEGSFHY